MDKPDPKPVDGRPADARELTRRRTRRAPVPPTGRVHHLGDPPAAQPVHTPTGVAWTETSPVRLRELSDGQLDRLAERLRGQVEAASAALEFERAADLLTQQRQVEDFRAARSRPPTD